MAPSLNYTLAATQSGFLSVLIFPVFEDEIVERTQKGEKGDLVTINLIIIFKQT